MVNLTLTPHRGNGARTFPATGYLGLTPVTLAGVVRVKIEEDMKAIEASSLVVRVRCYENIGGAAAESKTATTTRERRASASATGSSSSSSGYHSSSCLHQSSYSFTDMLKGGSSSSASSSSSSAAKGRVLYEKSITMWTPPAPTPPSTSTATSTPLSSRSSSLEQSPHAYPPRSRESSSSTASTTYATLGEFTKAWRIVIPTDAVDQGAKSTMIFKNWRIWWAVEAVISHRPLGIHGDRIVKSHQVALLSYAIPPSISSSTPMTWQSSTTDTHPLAYHITSPTSSYGSNDPVNFNIQLSKKSSTAETPKKVVLELRREIVFCPLSSSSDSPNPSSSSSNTTTTTKAAFENASTTASSSSSNTKKGITAPAPVAASSYFSTSQRHSRANSGPGAPSGIHNIIIPPLSSSAYHQHHASSTKLKSESQEALITTPPPLSNASTVSSFSTYMPSTPPLIIPTPSEYAESTGESYFGLKNTGADLHYSSRSTVYHSQQHHHYAPPAPVPIPIRLPSSSTTTLAAGINSSASKKKKEEATLAIFETDCIFTSSTWNGKINGTTPKAKSIYHYALGETCQTLSAYSKFYLVPKIIYKNKNSFIELPRLEIQFYTVSQEERKKAIEMRNRILAVQKAEARLFGGSTAAAEEDRIAERKAEVGREHTVKKRGVSGSKSNSTSDSKSTSTTSSSTLRSKDYSSATDRTRSSQSVSPKVGTGRSTRRDPPPVYMRTDAERHEDDKEEAPRLSTVRRRSEQADTMLDTPLRTRQRFGSTSDLSPVVGSPYLDAVSPSLSVISSSTTRPRTAGSGRSRPTTANSTRSTSNSARPRSSAGLDAAVPVSAWTTFSNSSGTFTIDPHADQSHSSLHTPSSTEGTATSSSSTMAVVSAIDSASASSMTSASDSTPPSSRDHSPKSTSSKENLNPQSGSNYKYSPVTPAAVNGLFADFSGFSLKQPDHAMMVPRVPIIREELVAPKPTVPRNISSSSSPFSKRSADLGVATDISSNKRKSTELLVGVGSVHTPSTSTHTHKENAHASTSSSSSSPIIAFHEITLASPPASIAMNPNNASNNSLLSPNAARSASSTIMTKSSSQQSAHSTTTVDLPHIAGQENARHSPRRVKSGMSGAFSFFRRTSTRT